MPGTLEKLGGAMLKRCAKTGSKILGEEVLASLFIRNLSASLDPKDWVKLLGSSVIGAIIPVPEAFSRLFDLVTDTVVGNVVDALSQKDKLASFVDLKGRLVKGEDMYTGITPTRFVMYKVSPMTFTIGRPILIIPRDLIVQCHFGRKLNILTYPYNLGLDLVFPHEIAFHFGVPRWAKSLGDHFAAVAQGASPRSSPSIDE